MKFIKSRKILLLIGMLTGITIFSFMLVNSLKALTLASKEFNFNFFLLGFSLIIFIIVYLSQMLNLWLIIRSNHSETKFLSICQGFSLGLIPKYIPGYIWGYISRGEWYLQNEQIPVRISWIASIIEIYITILSGLVIVTTNYLFSIRKQFLIFLLILISPIIGYLLIKYTLNLMQKIGRNKWGWNLNLEITMKDWLKVFINSILQWSLLGFGLWLIQRGFSGIQENISFLLVLNYSSTFSLAWLSGFIMIFVPNGLGVREFVLKELLTTYINFSIPTANLTSVLSRILLFIAEGFWFLIATISITFRGKQIK